VIRVLEFAEVGALNDSDAERYKVVAERVIAALDRLHMNHQAMVLTTTTNEAEEVESVFNAARKGYAFSYHGKVAKGEQRLDSFRKGHTKVLIVCGKLLEGFDQKTVAVCAILRNVQPSSRVLFAQFVGRAVRKLGADDPAALVISHVKHQQRNNFERLDTVADEDPDDD